MDESLIRRSGDDELNSLLVIADQLEVGISNPLQVGVGFLQPPLPMHPTVSLAVDLPSAEQAGIADAWAYHVPPESHARVRPCLFAGGRCDALQLGDVTRQCSGLTDHVPCPLQPPWGHSDDVYRQFRFLGLTEQSCPSRTLLLGRSAQILTALRTPAGRLCRVGFTHLR